MREHVDRTAGGYKIENGSGTIVATRQRGHACTDGEGLERPGVSIFDKGNTGAV